MSVDVVARAYREPLTSTVVARRAVFLEAGLRRLGLRAGRRAVLFVSDPRSEDTMVGCQAARALELDVVVRAATIEGEWHVLAREIAEDRPDVVLACARGTRALLAAGTRAVIVGDAPGVRWWAALELREEQELRRKADG